MFLLFDPLFWSLSHRRSPIFRHPQSNPSWSRILPRAETTGYRHRLSRSIFSLTSSVLAADPKGKMGDFPSVHPSKRLSICPNQRPSCPPRLQPLSLEKRRPPAIMVSSTLCPAVHILGSQNVYSRAEGIAVHYWPWADFSTM